MYLVRFTIIYGVAQESVGCYNVVRYKPKNYLDKSKEELV